MCHRDTVMSDVSCDASSEEIRCQETGLKPIKFFKPSHICAQLLKGGPREPIQDQSFQRLLILFQNKFVLHSLFKFFIRDFEDLDEFFVKSARKRQRPRQIASKWPWPVQIWLFSEADQVEMNFTLSFILFSWIYALDCRLHFLLCKFGTAGGINNIWTGASKENLFHRTDWRLLEQSFTLIMRGGNIFFLLPLLPFHLVLCVPLLLLPVCDLLVLVSPVGALSRPSYRDNHPSIHPSNPSIHL